MQRIRRRADWPARLESVPALVEEVETWLRALDFPAKRVLQIGLASEELSANIVRHAYAGGEERDAAIVVALAGDGADLTLRFIDAGRPFLPIPHPAHDPEAPLPQRPLGGLGLLLIKKLIGEVTYMRTGGHNQWTFFIGLDMKGQPC